MSELVQIDAALSRPPGSTMREQSLNVRKPPTNFRMARAETGKEFHHCCKLGRHRRPVYSPELDAVCRFTAGAIAARSFLTSEPAHVPFRAALRD
jgi:hypothetical protein